MTVSSTPARTGPLPANGVNYTWNGTFTIPNSESLKVIRLDGSTNIEEELSLAASYPPGPGEFYVTDTQAASFTVETYSTVPYPTGDSITMLLDMTFEQARGLSNTTRYRGETHEDALDELTMMLKQLDENLDRALSVSPTAPPGTDYTFPPYAAGEIVGWDEVQQALRNYNLAELGAVEVTAWSRAWLLLTNATEGRADLQVPWAVANAGPPGPTNDESAGHKALDLWLDTVGAEWYVCMDPAAGNAVWTPLWQQLTTLRAYDFSFAMYGGQEAGYGGNFDFDEVVRDCVLPKDAVGTRGWCDSPSHTGDIVLDVYGFRSSGWGTTKKLFDITFTAGNRAGSIANIDPDLAAGDLSFRAGDKLYLRDNDTAAVVTNPIQTVRVVLKGFLG